MTDLALLRDYAASGSNEAFHLVVQRHLGLVRGTALRQLRNDHHADEVSQAVFLALARKAGTLPEGTVIAGWLFRATRFAVAKLARDEERRSRRERESAMTHTETISEADTDLELWDRIAPHLNEALESLAQKDRDALLLRFFEQRPFAEVGRSLGTGEDAAKMRVGRALEKLRRFFRKRGFVLGVAALTSTLSSYAAMVVTPQGANTVASSVLKSGGASSAVAALADSILRHLLLLKRRLWLLITGAVLVTGTLIVTYQFGWMGQKNPTPAWRPPAPTGQQWPQR